MTRFNAIEADGDLLVTRFGVLAIVCDKVHDDMKPEIALRPMEAQIEQLNNQVAGLNCSCTVKGVFKWQRDDVAY